MDRQLLRTEQRAAVPAPWRFIQSRMQCGTLCRLPHGETTNVFLSRWKELCGLCSRIVQSWT